MRVAVLEEAARLALPRGQQDSHGRGRARGIDAEAPKGLAPLDRGNLLAQRVAGDRLPVIVLDAAGHDRCLHRAQT
jgi:hypothetical protein